MLINTLMVVLFVECAYFSIFFSTYPRQYPYQTRVIDCSEGVFISRQFLTKSLSVMSCYEGLWCLIHWSFSLKKNIYPITTSPL